MDPLKKPVPSGLDRPVRQKVYRMPVDWRARGNLTNQGTRVLGGRPSWKMG